MSYDYNMFYGIKYEKVDFVNFIFSLYPSFQDHVVYFSTDSLMYTPDRSMEGRNHCQAVSPDTLHLWGIC